MNNFVFMVSLFLVLNMTPLAFAKPQMDILAELEQRPGNPAVAPDGTVYFSVHPFDQPEYKIMRLHSGKAVPYPNEQISGSAAAVIGIHCTADGTLWWLDIGSAEISAKLVAWDTQNNQLKAIYTIPKEISVANSFHQDFAIDEKRRRAYIADMSRGNLIDESNPAIVVIDLDTGKMRRVLSGHDVFQAGASAIIAEGRAMSMRDEQGQTHPIRLGLNPIAIDPSNQWVYFSSMTPKPMYRVSAAVLANFSSTDMQIEQAIEVYGDKPSSDGIAVGSNGRVFITNVDSSEISLMDSRGTRTWFKDKRLVWPDGLFLTSDGRLIATVNQLHRAAIFNKGQSLAEKPYLIVSLSEK